MWIWDDTHKAKCERHRDTHTHTHTPTHTHRHRAVVMEQVVKELSGELLEAGKSLTATCQECFPSEAGECSVTWCCCIVRFLDPVPGWEYLSIFGDLSVRLHMRTGVHEDTCTHVCVCSCMKGMIHACVCARANM